jgi:hypothetical protein
MMGKYNTTFVDRSSAEEYLKATSGADDNTAVITDDMVNDDGKVLVQVQQSTAMYEGIRSAITHMYTLCRVPMPEEMKKDLSTLVAGLKEVVPVKLRHLECKSARGKSPISLESI